MKYFVAGFLVLVGSLFLLLSACSSGHQSTVDGAMVAMDECKEHGNVKYWTQYYNEPTSVYIHIEVTCVDSTYKEVWSKRK